MDDHTMRDDVRLSALLMPVLRGWRLIAGAVTAACTLAATIVLLLPRRYDAGVSMVTVMNPKNLPIGAGLASSLLGAASGVGLQATPAFVVRLGDLHSVVYTVALSRVDSSRSDLRVVDRVLGRSRPVQWRYDKIGTAMRHIIHTDYDRQTGIVTLSVTHKDSALARLIANRMVAEMSLAFLRTSRAQAFELRRAQEARVDSAAHQLAHVERQLVDFLSANRSIAPYSVAAIQRDELQRAISLAQTIYSQAASDREAAVAKELEETPAVVVLDPVPEYLMPVPRHAVLILILTALLTVLTAAVSLIVREAVRHRGTAALSPAIAAHAPWSSSEPERRERARPERADR